MRTELAIIACVEPGPLERQTLLLFESIRRNGGATAADAALHAFSPRGRGVPDETRTLLEDLSVVVHTERLNTTGLSYGPANRVYAAAWAETELSADLICVLDSDTIFLREPTALRLPDDRALAARPVDTTGTCTTGPGDEHEEYWAALCAMGETNFSDLGWVSTTVGGERVRASFNGGLTVSRSAAGLLNRAAELFTASIDRGLTPRAEPVEFRTGTGPVDPDASRWWGSSQAVLSVAAAALGCDILVLPPDYNVPLHLAERLGPPSASPVHVHYHWLWHDLAAVDSPSRALLGADESVLEWLNGAVERLGPIGHDR